MAAALLAATDAESRSEAIKSAVLAVAGMPVSPPGGCREAAVREVNFGLEDAEMTSEGKVK